MVKSVDIAIHDAAVGHCPVGRGAGSAQLEAERSREVLLLIVSL